MVVDGFATRVATGIPNQIPYLELCRNAHHIPRRIGETVHLVRGRRSTIFRMTKERWAQIGVTIDFLIITRALAEIVRLKHIHGASFSTATAILYIGGALMAVCACWIGVTFYFFRRYVLSAWITIAVVPLLLAYKMTMIGW